ncbi:MAG: cytochrome P450, partial [Holophagales bacterium]|nr:cytochrome P450 [Holophagales bacterium]
VLRTVTAVHHFRLTATEDVEMRGEVVRAGDKVAMWYTSANRDEDVFEDPYRFDVGRKPNRHLTFGIGPHFCLGAYLARLEIKIALEELRPHLGRLELVSEPERLRSHVFNGMTHRGVRYR